MSLWYAISVGYGKVFKKAPCKCNLVKQMVKCDDCIYIDLTATSLEYPKTLVPGCRKRESFILHDTDSLFSCEHFEKALVPNDVDKLEKDLKENPLSIVEIVVYNRDQFNEAGAKVGFPCVVREATVKDTEPL